MDKDRKLSVMSNASEDFSVQRQSMLLRELEKLLDLHPRELSSGFLRLPKEVRDRVFDFVLPDIATHETRPELHTCLWSADMIYEPWRHDIFGYGHAVPKEQRIHPDLLLVNKQLRNEILQNYFRKSKLTLHAELRNTRGNNWHFDYSPHIAQLPMLRHVTHVRFYVEWNYTIVSKNDRIEDQVRMTKDLMQAVDWLLAPLQAVEVIEISVLFFWKFRSGKFYPLSMQDLFDLEDVFKRHAESRWLRILRTNKSTVISPNSSAGVGYKLSSEDKKTEQSGGMDIFVSQDLEDSMRARRKSNVDFYGNYGISDPLPHPAYEHGKMI